MERLSQTYNSPIITFWVGRTPTLWLNDCWSASELLDKRERNYCSRPHLVVLGDLVGGQTNMVTMYYGDRWRLHRKLTHGAVGVHHVRLYRSFQDDESKVTALHLLSRPDDYERHFERFAASTVSIIGAGCRVASIHDPLITDVLAAAHHAGESIVPGKGFPIIMETFPIMAKFPPLRWVFKAAMNKGRDFYYDMAKRASERPEESFAKRVFNTDRPQYDLSREEIAALVGNLFGAGTDTSSSTLCTFLLACCAFPEALPPAWEELDWVVGRQRSPAVEDLDQLPYVAAFVKEVFRWRPVSVLGGQPHAPVHDDHYRVWFLSWTKVGKDPHFVDTPAGLLDSEWNFNYGQSLGHPSQCERLPGARSVLSRAVFETSSLVPSLPERTRPYGLWLGSKGLQRPTTCGTRYADDGRSHAMGLSNRVGNRCFHWRARQIGYLRLHVR